MKLLVLLWQGVLRCYEQRMKGHRLISTPDLNRALPSGTDLPIPWHLHLPRALERDFVTYLLEFSRRIILSSFFIVLLIYVGGSWVEYAVNDQAWLQTWRFRLFSLMSVGLVYWVAYENHHLQWLQPAVTAAVLILGASSNYSAVIVDDPLAYTYFFVNIFGVLLVSTLFRITLHWAAVVAALVLAMLGGTLYVHSNLSHTEATLVFFFVASCTLLSLFGQYHFERLQRQHFLAERVLAMHRTELRDANIVLENQAIEDPLTGTTNRRGMEVRLANLLHQARHNQQLDRIFLLLFDIDFFKQYNDTYGHLQGDKTLQAVAGVPKSMVQNEADFVARYGGEEFLVVLSGTRLNDALVFAERLRSRIEKLGIEHSGSRINNVITISVGVAGLAANVTRVEEVVRRADEALYEAKRQGRNRTVLLDREENFRII